MSRVFGGREKVGKLKRKIKMEKGILSRERGGRRRRREVSRERKHRPVWTGF